MTMAVLVAELSMVVGMEIVAMVAVVAVGGDSGRDFAEVLSQLASISDNHDRLRDLFPHRRFGS